MSRYQHLPPWARPKPRTWEEYRYGPDGPPPTIESLQLELVGLSSQIGALDPPKWSSKQWDQVQQLRYLVVHLEHKLVDHMQYKRKLRGEY